MTSHTNTGDKPGHRITVYASSSRALAPEYYQAASDLGRILATAGHTIVYGGGGAGLMGAVADAALEAGGEIYGVIPDFLDEIEAGHKTLTGIEVVPDMHTRKARMLAGSDAVVTLPGGCGTFEEFFEAITWKRLGLWLGAVIIVNTNGYYDKLQAFLEQSVEEKFMAGEHLSMWQVVERPDQVIEALENAPEWTEDARRFSAVGLPA